MPTLCNPVNMIVVENQALIMIRKQKLSRGGRNFREESYCPGGGSSSIMISSTFFFLVYLINNPIADAGDAFCIYLKLRRKINLCAATSLLSNRQVWDDPQPSTRDVEPPMNIRLVIGDGEPKFFCSAGGIIDKEIVFFALVLE